ncbi:hypothetical protein CIG75_02115 [Tumebacillus algifaecis]|uniref:Uncharacterized protein n=1 Tax=Tumebacillus algifaecis TaxID=1214604 RepID=A0A223CXE3_9BACL|nr:hypothetical protein [Tumebacillus algifaecis]ASS73885.1 hypothetical protein CIG75_02115 [Tumebacillus algifaecis]
MTYIPKTDWQNHEVLTAQDMNRIESAIESTQTKVETLKQDISDRESKTNETLLALQLCFINLAIAVESIQKSKLNIGAPNIFVESFFNTDDIVPLNDALKFDALNQKMYLM